MTTREALQHLQALGFSEYEARAYASLVQRGPLSGYQLAKASAIPRPNIYAVLERLRRRGTVARIEVKGGVRYAAVPSQEVLSRLSRDVQSHLSEAERALSGIAAPAPVEYVLNVEGYDGVMARAEALVDDAQRQLLAGIWAEESRWLSNAFARAEGRGVTSTVLCLQGCPQECGGCRGHVFRYPLAAGEHARSLILIADDRELLAGQVFEDGGATAVLTRLKVLTAMGSRYIQNTIAAAEIVRSVGRRLPQLIDSRALGAIQGPGLSSGGTPWLDEIFAAVGDGSA